MAGVLAATGATAVAETGSAQATPQVPDLRADVNRDGTVDVEGTGDTAGENTWTAGRGAIVLPNVDDDAKRCPVKDAQGRPLTDAKLAKCNDASDTKVNGARDAADLARLKTVPMPKTPAGSHGTVKTVGTGAKKARLFIKRDGRWSLLRPTDRLTAKELRTGVELGIEATDVVRDAAKWDGKVKVRFTVTSGGTSTADDVVLRTAPVLTHHHLQRAEEVLVTEVQGEGPYSRAQQKFVKDFAKKVKDAGISKPLTKFTKYADPWAQDFVEPAYASAPGPGGKQHTMRVLIRSAQPDRDAGRELFEKLRGPDVGVVQVSGVRDSEEWTLNSMGNLETIPPYTLNGKSYPAGRIIQGYRADSGSKPAKAMRTFLSSQGVQAPLLLDTSWLSVGHVDEFVQFLPADTPRGWRVGVADPALGVELLAKAKRDGHGAKKMFSVPRSPDVPAPKETIDQVLASSKFQADNKLAADRIKANLAILKRETGITDDEIVKVPGLFTRDGDESAAATGSRKLRRMGPDRLQKFNQLRGADEAKDRGGQGSSQNDGGTARQAPTRTHSAYVPGAVNGVLLSPTRYLAPQQWGPVIGGRDIFTDAVTSVYAKAGFTTTYIDDWYTYHLGMGEVHCGTNTLRDATAPWWPKA
ncbi:protein-arginine deiminase domain-containing protein [Streptomyces flavofungini]|uniref:Protein-arginine deiminase domain-containing protein n=1 Tax=Streptomyces flavofungini TaxID=68200 RepID=A0ABS0XD99_9ACTN|nr:protein-arginine deiminase domain-containing protein [Streptomyces flavofungini]MBJ3811170.1 protein-arginine deiminase domain-containing protein [Streptomyces flavofungini]